MADDWDLLFTFPNLSSLPKAYSDDRLGFAICSAVDERLSRLKDSVANATMLDMLAEFRTARGIAYKPAVFLVRADTSREKRTGALMRAFRNCAAIATLTAAMANDLARPHGRWSVRWSDHFLFGYFVAGRTGAVQTLNGPVVGIDGSIPTCQPSPGFSHPGHWSVLVDQPLLTRLFNALYRFQVQRRHRTRLARLFRSLEVAFHAGLFPSDGLTRLDDIGTRIGLWVSAFEVLCHPGNRSVSKRDVQLVLQRTRYSRSELTVRRFRVNHAKQSFPATLPEALYDDLYWARNRFLHGSPITASTFRYQQSLKHEELVYVAPVLYASALTSFLDEAKIPEGPQPPPKTLTPDTMSAYMHSREGLERVERALVAAATREP